MYNLRAFVVPLPDGGWQARLQHVSGKITLVGTPQSSQYEAAGALIFLNPSLFGLKEVVVTQGEFEEKVGY
jgi:hypothetical protein